MEVMVHKARPSTKRDVPRGIPKSSKLILVGTLEEEPGIFTEVQALVDTGAEVNLINPAMVDSSRFQPSSRPVRLGAANSLRLSGGTRETMVFLTLQGVQLDSKQPVEVGLPITAYDADIKYDLILSYGWLAQQDIQINPRRHGVLIKDKMQAIWVPGKIFQPGPNTNVGTVPIEVQALPNVTSSSTPTMELVGGVWCGDPPLPQDWHLMVQNTFNTRDLQ